MAAIRAVIFDACGTLLGGLAAIDRYRAVLGRCSNTISVAVRHSH
jgi:FMN phosphatase YigB (HAD superfamily)